jgi:peptidyl-prolyl cis-trans isomerase B (cyclophilin B)
MLLVRLLVVCVLGLALAGCGGDDEGQGDETAAGTTTAETVGTCAVATAAGPRSVDEKAPTALLDAAKTYRLAVDTSCGPFTIELDQKQAPKTAASLVALARKGFFDGTTFHRVVPGFVIQGGDPTGSGSGGPGYQTVDAPPEDAAYTVGVVAMAKTPQEPPGTSGSQFFIVTGADVGLPPDYAIVGKVVEGMKTVRAIEALGLGDAPPTMTVVIRKITVEES